jgi:hypothetical protein
MIGCVCSREGVKIILLLFVMLTFSAMGISSFSEQAKDYGSVKVKFTHSHDHEHAHHHQDGESNRSQHHHSDSHDTHSHVYNVSCAHAMMIEAKPAFAMIGFDRLHSFPHSKDLLPPRKRSLGSIFRPPIDA